MCLDNIPKRKQMGPFLSPSSQFTSSYLFFKSVLLLSSHLVTAVLSGWFPSDLDNNCDKNVKKDSPILCKWTNMEA